MCGREKRWILAMSGLLVVHVAEVKKKYMDWR